MQQKGEKYLKHAKYFCKAFFFCPLFAQIIAI
jgi:hypothetical protein